MGFISNDTYHNLNRFSILKEQGTKDISVVLRNLQLPKEEIFLQKQQRFLL